MAQERNVCAGPFGAVYDFYIERPLLARLILGSMWGVDPRPFYRSLASVSSLPDGATVLDVPCGGGVALRGLRPGQRVHWVGVDIEPAMLTRARRRAARHPGADIDLVEGDMYRLPLEDSTCDLCLSYGGLHCLSRPQRSRRWCAACAPAGICSGAPFSPRGAAVNGSYCATRTSGAPAAPLTCGSGYTGRGSAGFRSTAPTGSWCSGRGRSEGRTTVSAYVWRPGCSAAGGGCRFVSGPARSSGSPPRRP
jgi:SAM-dependent methyltransferase